MTTATPTSREPSPTPPPTSPPDGPATPAEVAGLDDPGISTYGRLLETVRRLDRVFHRTITERCGMPGPRFELLLRVARSPDEQLSISALADQLGVTPGGATRLVDRVADDGLVQRRACTDDRRVQFVCLTDAGRARLDEVLRLHREDLAREITDRLDPATRQQLNAILDVLRHPPS